MKVHLVHQTVDLGSHVIAVYANEEDANTLCDEKNAEEKARYKRVFGDRYFVEAHDVL